MAAKSGQSIGATDFSPITPSCLGMDDQMKVIRHEAIGADFDSVMLGMFLNQ